MISKINNIVFISLFLNLGLSQDCVDLSGISFPECGTVVGFGYVDGECQTMYCSSIDGYGVDWSNWIYDTIEECESICLDEYPIIGDLNADGNVDILDVIILVNHILSPAAIELDGADINNDGEVNILDVIQLVNIILGVA